MMDQPMRLTSELVPEGVWYANLRKLVPKKEWDRIRKAAYAAQDNRCAICGAEGRLNCHEVWEYDDAKRLQRLTGFVALCTMCHHVKHLGMASILAHQGHLDYEAVVQHFMDVNGCDRKTFEDYRTRVFDQWQERSRHEWSVDFGEYAGLVTER